MSHIDFVIAFALTIGIILFAIFFVNNNFSRDFNYFRIIDLQKSESSLEGQLFETENDKSLVSNFNKIQILFKEIGNRTHSEQINISLEPVVNKVHVYDSFTNEIRSVKITDGNKVFITFTLSFSSYEKKKVNIIYYGDKTTSIDYISSNNEVEGKIISEKIIPVVSQEKCSSLNSTRYEDAKNIFGFEHQFKIILIECNYGVEPPAVANIISKEVPVLIEKSDEIILASKAKVMVW